MFRLYMGPDMFVGLVQKQEPLHWGAESVAHVLKYKNVYQFRTSKHTVGLEDLPDAILPSTLLESRLRYIPHHRLLYVLKRTKSPYVQILYDQLLKLNFNVITSQDSICTFYQCVEGTPGSQSILSAIYGYKHRRIMPPAAPPPPHPDHQLPFRKRTACRTQSPPPPVLSPASLFLYSGAPPTADSPQYTPMSPVPKPTPMSPIARPSPPHTVQSGLSMPWYYSPRSPSYPPPEASTSRPAAESEVGKGDGLSRPCYSPHSPSYSPTPRPAAENEVGKGAFHLWMDRMPPTKILIFYGSHVKRYVEASEGGGGETSQPNSK